MAKYILGIDEGTTGARAFVINDQCEVLGLASAELTQHYPRPGWIEHDPMEILNVQLEVIRAALRQAKLQPSDLSAVALTNQRETGIVWEKDTGGPSTTPSCGPPGRPSASSSSGSRRATAT